MCMRQLERIEYIDGSRATEGGGCVMIANDKNDGDLCLSQAPQLKGELSLPCGVGGGCPIEISRKQDGIDLALNGSVEDCLQAVAKIEQTGVQARGWIEPTVVLDPQMEIGEMEQLHRRPRAGIG